jgi:hypothetical protein
MTDREEASPTEAELERVRVQLQADLAEIARKHIQFNASLPRPGIPSRQFVPMLQRRLWPVLKAQGFQRHGQIFHRYRGAAIHALRFEPSNLTKDVRINLGIHFKFLPPLGGGEVSNRIDIVYCAFQRELGADDENRERTIWNFGLSEAAAEETITDILRVYKSTGVAYFDKWGVLPGALTKIAVEDIDKDYAPPFRYPTTPWECALTLAELHSHLGDDAKAEAFARFGMTRIWPGHYRFFSKFLEAKA